MISQLGIEQGNAHDHTQTLCLFRQRPFQLAFTSYYLSLQCFRSGPRDLRKLRELRKLRARALLIRCTAVANPHRRCTSAANNRIHFRSVAQMLQIRSSAAKPLHRDRKSAAHSQHIRTGGLLMAHRLEHDAICSNPLYKITFELTIRNHIPVSPNSSPFHSECIYMVRTRI